MIIWASSSETVSNAQKCTYSDHHEPTQNYPGHCSPFVHSECSMHDSISGHLSPYKTASLCLRSKPLLSTYTLSFCMAWPILCEFAGPK